VSVGVKVPGGTVYLIDSLSVPMAAGALAAMEGTPATEGSMQATLVAVFLQPVPRGAIEGWTFMEKPANPVADWNGLPEAVPVTDENIARLLPWGKGGLEVAEKCNELYAGDLFTPLVARHRKSLQDIPKDHLTSATPVSGSKHPKRSKRSSQNGTAGMHSVVPAR
jgi:hypothetical protein